MTQSKSMRANEIPICLVPRATARLIRKRGEIVYRTRVARRHFHHDNISVRTRSLPCELRAREKFMALDCGPVPGDDDCEGGIA